MSITSKVWKKNHTKGTEYSAEVKNARAYRSYLQNPKQAHKNKDNKTYIISANAPKNGVCKKFTKAEILAFEIKLN